MGPMATQRLRPRAATPSLLVGMALLASLSACGERDAQGSDGASGDAPSVAHHNEDTGWRNPFSSHDDAPSSSTLADSHALDEVKSLIDDGLFDQARLHLAPILQRGTANPVAYELAAQLSQQQGDDAQTIAYCRQAIQLNSFAFEPRIMLAQTYIKLKRLEAAEDVLHDMDQLDPTSPWGPYGLGIIELMRNHQDRGIAYLDEALHRDPDHGPSLRARADCAAAARDEDLEEKLLFRYIAGNPSDASAFASLGDIAKDQGRPSDARTDYLRSYALQPDPTVARRIVELARQRGDAGEAAAWRARAGIADPAHRPAPAH